jgi:uncharacterized membrane protein
MQRYALVSLFVIFSLLFVLLVVDSYTFRSMENMKTNYWINAIAAILVFVIVLYIIYQIAKNTNVIDATAVQH